MSEQLSNSARQVQKTLDKHELSFDVQELPDSTRTAKEAANAIGCTISQIAKSIVFKGNNSGQPFLAILSGTNRADVSKLAVLAGEPIGNANADYVRAHTGFAIGGVPPTGHVEKIKTFIDEDLLQYDEIWAAAGTPKAVFNLQPTDLIKLTDGRVADLKELSG